MINLDLKTRYFLDNSLFKVQFFRLKRELGRVISPEYRIF